MAQPQVFLSHSTKDADFTRRLAADLRGAGATVHIVSAQDGGDFVKRINDALAACEWVVLVLTSDALSSPWVESEMNAAIRLARQGSIRNFLPIQAGPVDYRTLPALLGNYNIFDATRDYASARDALLRTLGLSYVAAPAISADSPNPLPPSLGGKGPQGDRAAVGARPVSPVVSPVIPPVVSPPPAADPSILPSRLAQIGFAAYRNGSTDYIVPPVVSVPAGVFLMGSDPAKDKQSSDDEKPQHKVSLPAFQIGKFPLTVAEYACFVRAGQKQPRNWQGQIGKLDHPVVYVSWHDAVAYAAWLAKLTGQPWRLPSEAEWEKAARGSDGRIYPWGDSFDKSRCNTSEGGRGAMTPVGSCPSGASPYGAQDMAGNVWEWTSAIFKSYPYSATDDRENDNTTDNRVLRGGSWGNSSRLARAAFRYPNRPDVAYVFNGARLACAVPNS